MESSSLYRDQGSKDNEETNLFSTKQFSLRMHFIPFTNPKHVRACCWFSWKPNFCWFFVRRKLFSRCYKKSEAPIKSAKISFHIKKVRRNCAVWSTKWLLVCFNVHTCIHTHACMTTSKGKRRKPRTDWSAE